MKVGDLVMAHGWDAGIVINGPRLSEDCKPGGDAWPNEWYYLVSVLLQSGELEDFEEEDLEVINEGR